MWIKLALAAMYLCGYLIEIAALSAASPSIRTLSEFEKPTRLAKINKKI
jgi:hypothetical protein